VACRFDPALPFRPEALRWKAARHARELTAAASGPPPATWPGASLQKWHRRGRPLGSAQNLNLSIELVDERRITWRGRSRTRLVGRQHCWLLHRTPRGRCCASSSGTSPHDRAVRVGNRCGPQIKPRRHSQHIRNKSIGSNLYEPCGETRPTFCFAFLPGTSAAHKSAGVHLFITQVPSWASARPSCP
jgi:hypothetical protein